MFSLQFRVLLLAAAVSSLAGCSCSSRGFGSFAVHGPCKTLGVDARPGQGAPGPDVCLHDRCLGWMVGRNRGPFYHFFRGSTDPGCGPCNCRSLVGGSQTISQQFPGVAGSTNSVINQTAYVKRGPTPASQVTYKPAAQVATQRYTRPTQQSRTRVAQKPSYSNSRR